MTLERDFENHMRQVLESGHTTRAGADAPPADTWQRVMARCQPPSEEETTMEHATLATPMNVPMAIPSSQRRSMASYLNIAATVALVLTIALGGWLAAIRMNQPGDPDPRFAVLPATPLVDQGQTCDVEPLSVDRAMEIVKNPGYFMLNGSAGPRSESAGGFSPPNAELWEVTIPLDSEGPTSAPTQEIFDSTSLIANEYAHCMVFGTQGQVWTFYSPAMIQSKILAEFPVFASEEEVRARVEERIVLPASEGESVWEILAFLDEVETVTVNPDVDLAIWQQSRGGYYEQQITFGYQFKDSNGETLALSNGTGRDMLPKDTMSTSNFDGFLKVTLVKLYNSDTWMVIPYPSNDETGWMQISG